MLNDRPLAPTSFMSGPMDDLIVDDVYEKADDNVINKFPDVALPGLDQNQLVAQDKSIADDLRGGMAKSIGLPSVNTSIFSKATDFLKSGVTALGGAANLVSLATKVAGPSIAARLGVTSLTGIPGLSSSAGSALSGLLRNAPAGLSSVLSQPLGSTLGAYSQVGGATTRLNSGQILSSNQITGLINSLTGTTSGGITDKDMTSRLISGISSVGLTSGIPNSFSSLASLAGGDRNILLNAGVALLPAIKSLGSVSGLKDVTSVLGGDTVRNSSSNILPGVARNYTLPPNSTTTVINYEYDQTKATFASVDPNWNTSATLVPALDSLGLPTYDVNGNPLLHTETRVDLTAIQAGSPDFLSMMERGAVNSTDSTQKFNAMAGMFKQQTPEESLAKNYPQTVTSLKTQTTLGTDRSAYANDRDYLAANTIIMSDGVVLPSKLYPSTDRRAYDSDLAYLKANTIIR